MTEFDLFVKCIPMIAEMVIICRKLNQQDYEDFKCEAIKAAPESVKEFIGKVLTVIDKYTKLIED